MDLLFWVTAILVFIFGTTYLLKKFTKAETFYAISLVRTKRLIPLLDRFTKPKRLLNWFASAGLVLGFGAIAVDYLFGRKKRLPSRIAIFIASVLLLTAFFQASFPLLLENPFIESASPAIAASFGAFGFAGFTISSLAAYGYFIAVNVAAGEQVCPGVAPLIPGVELPNVPLVVPFHAWLSFLIILVIHEGMHGILARKAKIKVKSAGLLLLGLLPIGAFVEPNEQQLKRAKPIDALRVYSAGPAANLAAVLLISVLFSLFVVLIIVPFFSPSVKQIHYASVESVVVGSVDENIDWCGKIYESPAFGKLNPGMEVKKVNDANVLVKEDFYIVLLERKPFTLTVSENGIETTHPIIPLEIGAVGFRVEDKLREGYELPLSYTIFMAGFGFLDNFIFWLIILNLLIAIVNFLPIEPFDGGKIAKIMLLPYFSFLKMPKKDTEKFIGRLFAWIVVALLILNALPLFL